MAVLVFKLLNGKVLFINKKHNRIYFFRKKKILSVNKLQQNYK